MTSYCQISKDHYLHQPYHDMEYGFPIEDEAALFERLILEINQAGLSWELILKKKNGFSIAYDGYDIDKITAYDDNQRQRLLNNSDIIRNKLKINAAIHNANIIKDMREANGGFAAWIAAEHPRKRLDWVKLFKKTFKFTGGEITNEFLMSIGYLPGAHIESCPIYKKIAKLNPPWMQIGKEFYQ